MGDSFLYNAKSLATHCEILNKTTPSSHACSIRSDIAFDADITASVRNNPISPCLELVSIPKQHLLPDSGVGRRIRIRKIFNIYLRSEIAARLLATPRFRRDK
jgi:hypothetical protein